MKVLLKDKRIPATASPPYREAATHTVLRESTLSRGSMTMPEEDDEDNKSFKKQDQVYTQSQSHSLR